MRHVKRTMEHGTWEMTNAKCEMKRQIVKSIQSSLAAPGAAAAPESFMCLLQRLVVLYIPPKNTKISPLGMP